MSTSLEPSNMCNYRLELDGLRAISVIAVIINHFNSALLPSGFLGVDIFFVISGYVITLSLINMNASTLNELLLNFYTKRIKRLLPALIVCVIVSAIALCLVSPTPQSSLKTGIFSLFGFSNLHLLALSVDYFGGSSKYNAFTQTWSLGVEEQFYFIFPFILWFSTLGLTKKVKAFQKIMLIAIFVSLILFLVLNYINREYAYYLMPTRWWELGLGSLLVIYSKKPPPLISKLPHNFSSVILFLMILTLFMPLFLISFSTILIVLLSALLIATHQPETKAHTLLTLPVSLYLGKISYSLYLWHWPIISISYWTIGVNVKTLPFQLLIIFLISVLSYHYVELPLRYTQWSTSRLKSISCGLIGSTIAAACIVTLALPLKGKLYQGNIIIGGEPVHNELNCHKGNLETCLTRKGTKVNLFLIGDSHLTNLVPSIEKSLEHTDLQSSYFGGVKFIRTIFDDKYPMSDITYKNDVQRIILHLSKHSKSQDTVIFSMSRNRIYLPNNYEFTGNSRHGKENFSRMQLLYDALSELAEAVIRLGGKFILVDDIPSTCSIENIVQSSFKASSCRPSMQVSLDDREPLTQVYLKLAKNISGVYYIDPHKELCPNQFCLLLANKKPIYVDDSPHISIDNRYILSSFFKENLLPIIATNSLA